MWLAHLAWLCKSWRVARDHPLREPHPVGNLDFLPMWTSQGSWTSDGAFSFSERESENHVFFLKLGMKLATVRPVQNQRGKDGNTCVSNSVTFWCEGWCVQGVAGLAVSKYVDRLHIEQTMTRGLVPTSARSEERNCSCLAGRRTIFSEA